MTGHEENNWVSAYMDGELSPAEHVRMETHLAGCGDCRASLEETRRVKTLMAGAPRFAMPAPLFTAVAHMVRRSALRQRLAGWFRGPKVWVPLAAAAAATAFFLLGPSLQPSADNEAIPLEVLMAAHERYAVDRSMPSGDFSRSNYALQLTSYEGN